MELRPGTTLGSYEITAPIGAGAMGAVYRARDARLGRSVALKVISEKALRAPNALQRFEQEARAASAIAHPNIVTVHEIGVFDEIPYIVMELVDGKSLRRLLEEGTLPLKKLLDIAVQIADGLAAAHSSGIVHRDLKPENVMVTPAGVVKILDFGLARPFTSSGLPADSTLTSPVQMTDPGVILGTVSYMSPEQARGRDVDFRSDQFSFGALLYEMATGRVAFRKESGAETLTAIIREEPFPVRDLAPASPVPLRWIIERCLVKEREGRYDSTQDLARELRALREHASEIGSAASAPRAETVAESRGPRRGWVAAVAILSIVATSAIGLALKWRAPRPFPTFKRLTFQRGHVTGARFAPDGQTVLYSAAWEGNPSEIFSTHLSGPGSRSLGISPAWLSGVSDTGEIALRFTYNTDDLGNWFTGTLALAPLGGGTPREIREWVGSADISRDGKSLAAVTHSNFTGDQSDVEYPLGTKLARGVFNRPRISPDGRLLALVEAVFPGPKLTITTIDREGKRRVLSKEWRLVLSPVWSPKGDEVWYSAGDGLPQVVLAADLTGQTRELLRIPPIVILEDVSRDGRVLLKRQDRRSGILCRLPGEPTERDLSWFDQSELAAMSRDGNLVLFSDAGTGPAKRSVYVRKTDGSPATRLGEGSAVALSPDGKWALSESNDDPKKLLLLPIGPQESRALDLGVEYSGFVGWSPDGSKFLYLGVEADRSRRLYELTLSTGENRPVGSMMLVRGWLSPDGKSVAGCQEAFRKCAVFPLDGGPPRPIPGYEEWLSVVAWDPDGRSVYVSDGGMPRKISRVRLQDGHTELWKEIRPSEMRGIAKSGNIAISPATGAYAYTYERVLSELYLVEGLR